MAPGPVRAGSTPRRSLGCRRPPCPTASALRCRSPLGPGRSEAPTAEEPASARGPDGAWLLRRGEVVSPVGLASDPVGFAAIREPSGQVLRLQAGNDLSPCWRWPIPSCGRVDDSDHPPNPDSGGSESGGLPEMNRRMGCLVPEVDPEHRTTGEVGACPKTLCRFTPTG